ADRQVSAATTHADQTPVPAASQVFDGLGRVKETLSGDVATTPSYGAGGIPEKATLTPRSKDFPGPETVAKTRADLSGEPVVKTLDQGSAERSGITVKRDDAGRVVEEKEPGGGITKTVYNERGEVEKTTGPDGAVTTHTYDPATGRVLETVTVSGDGKRTEKTAYTYDQATGRVTGVYDPADKQGTLITYRYSFTGKVLEVAYPDGKKTSQSFDRHDQMVSATDITGATTAYAYNKDGTLKQAVQKGKDGAALAEVSYTYDGLGRMLKVERGNKTVTVYGYNDAGQITTDKTTRADGSVITEASYTYDSHGNLTSRTDTRPEVGPDGTPLQEEGGKGTVKNATTTASYRYDAYNRLINSTLKDAGGKLLAETAYTLNASGDVTRTDTTRYEGGQAKKETTEHGIDAGGRLTSVTTDGQNKTQAFDAAGNLLTDHRGTAWTYNTRNQPLTATTADGTVTAYTYWADGTRRDATVTSPDGTSTRTGFYYSPDGAITNDTHTTPGQDSKAPDSGTVTASYLSAAAREARTLTASGGDTASDGGEGAGYLLHDRHGSTTALTTTGQAATVGAAWNYSDYGQHTTTTGTLLTSPGTGSTGTAGSSTPAGAAAPAPGAVGVAVVNPFTYSGEHTDTRLGTQYLKNRIYDTGQGRFTTRDTAPLHNRYQYADANPVTNTDPTGNTAVLDRIVSGVMIGVTILMAVVTVAITAATAGIGTALGIALAGAVLDTASAAVETAALATGNNQWDSPLNIAAYTLGAAGLILGGIGATIGLGKAGGKATVTTRKAVKDARVGSEAEETMDVVPAGKGKVFKAAYERREGHPDHALNAAYADTLVRGLDTKPLPGDGKKFTLENALARWGEPAAQAKYEGHVFGLIASVRRDSPEVHLLGYVRQKDSTMKTAVSVIYPNGSYRLRSVTDGHPSFRSQDFEYDSVYAWKFGKLDSYHYKGVIVDDV
ncbi:RHS repeat-associated core domain-containing protein, partial [Streptomyces sp. NPDC057910]|uniref:RHS repeat-associated core domain-containing protein n=1 Tax=Streptomyces sp. NPDC057910 TaxID=3346278 RepID=UPI0036E5DAF9